MKMCHFLSYTCFQQYSNKVYHFPVIVLWLEPLFNFLSIKDSLLDIFLTEDILEQTQYSIRPFKIKYCKTFCRQSNLIRYNRNHNSQTSCMQIRVCERILPFFFSFSDPQTHIPKMIMASIYMEYIFE